MKKNKSMGEKPTKLSGCNDVLMFVTPARPWQLLLPEPEDPLYMRTGRGSGMGASARPDITVIDSPSVHVCVYCNELGFRRGCCVCINTG